MSGWIFGGAAIGIVAACWRNIKWVGNWILSIFIVKVQLGMDLERAVKSYLFHNTKKSPFGIFTYGALPYYIKSKRRKLSVAFEYITPHSTLVFWKGWRPLMIMGFSAHGGQNQGAGNTPDSTQLLFIRGTFNLDKFIVDIIDFWNEKAYLGHRNKRFRVINFIGEGSIHSRSQNSKESPPQDSNSNPDNYVQYTLLHERYLKWNRDDLDNYESETGDPLGFLEFDQEVWNVIHEIDIWIKCKDWFIEKGIPWKFGVLFYGKPGTGKTSLIRALAEHLDLPINSFNLASMNNQELYGFWNRMKVRAPCIALIEDIDTIFDEKRNNLQSEYGGGLSFEALLNCIDGVENNNGVLTFITTNHPERLDPALGRPDYENGSQISTRPGRIDRVLELKPLDDKGRYNMASRILSSYPDLIDKAVEDGKGETGAQFQNRCAQIALEKFWNNNKV